MIIILSILLFLAVLLEGTITTLPLTLGCLICLAVMKQDTSVFLPAFLAGLVIDLLHVQPVGATSIFYVCILFLILLYKKKYEIYSLPFVLIASFLGAFFFLLIFTSENILVKAAITAVSSVIFFAVLRFFGNAKEQKQKTKFLTV